MLSLPRRIIALGFHQMLSVRPREKQWFSSMMSGQGNSLDSEVTNSSASTHRVELGAQHHARPLERRKRGGVDRCSLTSWSFQSRRERGTQQREHNPGLRKVEYETNRAKMQVDKKWDPLGLMTGTSPNLGLRPALAVLSAGCSFMKAPSWWLTRGSP